MLVSMESILTVDDELALLEICRLYLEHTNEFEVVTASSASEAFNQITILLGYPKLSQELDPPFEVQDFIRRGIRSAE